MTVGDGVELAGLVVALVVGIPATVAAVIMIRDHMKSNKQRFAGTLSLFSAVYITGD